MYTRRLRWTLCAISRSRIPGWNRWSARGRAATHHVDGGSPSRERQSSGSRSSSSPSYGSPSRERQSSGSPSRERQNSGSPSRERQNSGSPSRERQNSGSPSGEHGSSGSPSGASPGSADHLSRVSGSSRDPATGPAAAARATPTLSTAIEIADHHCGGGVCPRVRGGEASERAARRRLLGYGEQRRRRDPGCGGGLPADRSSPPRKRRPGARARQGLLSARRALRYLRQSVRTRAADGRTDRPGRRLRGTWAVAGYGPGQDHASRDNRTPDGPARSSSTGCSPGLPPDATSTTPRGSPRRPDSTSGRS